MIAHSKNPQVAQRRGFGLPEIAVTALILALTIVIVGEGVVWLANSRRSADRKQRAIQEAANLMERISARPWNELTPEFGQSITLDPATSALLSQGKVEVIIAQTTSAPLAKKISVAVQSRDAMGNPQRPVRLVTWVYHREGDKP